MSSFCKILMLFLGSLVVAACVTASSTTSKASLSYAEDLSSYKPIVVDSGASQTQTSTFRTTAEAFTASSDITSLLNSKLDTLAESNKAIRSVRGLTVQIYSGSSSELAYQARDSAIVVLPEVRTVVQYNQPIYKVRVGRFTEKLEAQRTLMKLKPKFPGAIAVPTTIYIN
ncbi:MAG: hypothetical protein ACJAT1_000960 [Marivirga sp.]|jgi:hypothetical protein